MRIIDGNTAAEFIQGMAPIPVSPAAASAAWGSAEGMDFKKFLQQAAGMFLTAKQAGDPNMTENTVLTGILQEELLIPADLPSEAGTAWLDPQATNVKAEGEPGDKGAAGVVLPGQPGEAPEQVIPVCVQDLAQDNGGLYLAPRAGQEAGMSGLAMSARPVPAQEQAAGIEPSGPRQALTGVQAQPVLSDYGRAAGPENEVVTSGLAGPEIDAKGAGQAVARQVQENTGFAALEKADANNRNNAQMSAIADKTLRAIPIPAEGLDHEPVKTKLYGDGYDRTGAINKSEPGISLRTAEGPGAAKNDAFEQESINAGGKTRPDSVMTGPAGKAGDANRLQGAATVVITEKGGGYAKEDGPAVLKSTEPDVPAPGEKTAPVQNPDTGAAGTRDPGRAAKDKPGQNFSLKQYAEDTAHDVGNGKTNVAASGTSGRETGAGAATIDIYAITDKKLPEVVLPHLVKAAGEMTRDNNQVTVIRLKIEPENLGEIRIKLSYQQGELSARFITSSGAVRDAVEYSLPQLREALARLDINLSEASAFNGNDQPSGREFSADMFDKRKNFPWPAPGGDTTAEKTPLPGGGYRDNKTVDMFI